jgi:hypothetical protein
MLVIIAPPEADYFSFDARSAANEKNIFLCDLCGSSPHRLLRGPRRAGQARGECFFIFFHLSQILRESNLIFTHLSKSILVMFTDVCGLWDVIP